MTDVAPTTTASTSEGDEGADNARDREHAGEHAAEAEESGEQLGRNQTYTRVHRGARLVLSFNATTNTFVGTVFNTGENTLERVRVEVHRSNGTELGPTVPVDLGPGESSRVELPATAAEFETWSAHAEVGRGERG